MKQTARDQDDSNSIGSGWQSEETDTAGRRQNELGSSCLEEISIDRSQPIVPQIYQALRRHIVDNRLAPGAVLSEGLVAKQMDISRTPLRTAMQQLAAEGLISTRPQVGSVVAPHDQSRVEEAVFVRGALEEGIVRRLAEAGTALTELAPVLAAQKAAADLDDYMTFFRYDEEFHSKLAMLARCPNTWPLIQGFKAHVDRQRLMLMSSITGRSRQAYEEHLAIVEEIEAGRPEGAVIAMRKHVCTVLDTSELER